MEPKLRPSEEVQQQVKSGNVALMSLQTAVVEAVATSTSTTIKLPNSMKSNLRSTRDNAAKISITAMRTSNGARREEETIASSEEATQAKVPAQDTFNAATKIQEDAADTIKHPNPTVGATMLVEAVAPIVTERAMPVGAATTRVVQTLIVAIEAHRTLKTTLGSTDQIEMSSKRAPATTTMRTSKKTDHQIVVEHTKVTLSRHPTLHIEVLVVVKIHLLHTCSQGEEVEAPTSSTTHVDRRTTLPSHRARIKTIDAATSKSLITRQRKIRSMNCTNCALLRIGSQCLS